MKPFALIILLMLSCSAVSNQSNIISLVAPDFWCPYACNEKEPLQGFAIDIARAAFKEVGITVEYSNQPYDRALLMVRKGKIDGVIPTFKEEAPDFIYPKKSVSKTEYCFYNNDLTWQYSGLTSLKDISFGITSGYSYGPTMDAYIENKTPQEVYKLMGSNIPDRLYNMLINGRFNAILEDKGIMEFYFKTHQDKPILNESGCLKEMSYGFLALSPADKLRSHFLADQFDLGLEKIIKKGIQVEILNRYKK